MKKQKLIAVSILFALISATAFNYAVAGNAFSDLQGAAEDSNTTIAFDGLKVYSNTAPDSVVEFEYPDNYDENDYDQTEIMTKELENNADKNFSTAASLSDSKIPSLTSSKPTEHHHYFHDDDNNNNYQEPKKPWREQTPKEKVKTVVEQSVFGGFLGGLAGIMYGAVIGDGLTGAAFAFAVPGIIVGAVLVLGLYFYGEW